MKALRMVLVCAFGIWLCEMAWAAASEAASATVGAAWHRAQTGDAVYENAMYLFLRIAGVVWIAVEWVAAFILWRTMRLMSAAARARGLLR